MNNDFKKILSEIENANKEMKEFINSNKEKFEELGIDNSNESKELHKKEKNEDDLDYLRALANICLENLEALKLTLNNKTNNDKFIFNSVLSLDQRKIFYSNLNLDEKYEYETNIIDLNKYNKNDLENIIFNIQAEYILRSEDDGDLDLITDLFK